MAGAVDRIGDGLYQTALVRAYCAERLEFTLLGLGDYRLGVGEDLATADRNVCFLDR